MNEESLDRVLRHGLVAHDLPDDRIAEIREEAHRELRHSARTARRGWRSFETGASLVAAAAQLVWVFASLFGQ